MKILIREKTKKLYLDNGDRWVETVEQGRDFVSCTDAITHLTSERMKDVELYCSFPNPQFDFALPLEAFDRVFRGNEKNDRMAKRTTDRKRT